MSCRECNVREECQKYLFGLHKDIPPYITLKFECSDGNEGLL